MDVFHQAQGSGLVPWPIGREILSLDSLLSALCGAVGDGLCAWPSAGEWYDPCLLHGGMHRDNEDLVLIIKMSLHRPQWQ